MTGIDTNVLVRYLTRDDPDQYQRAKQFLETQCTQDNQGYINPIVLCEISWVLQSAYDATKAELVQILNQILRTRQFEVGHRSAVQNALDEYERGTADFADCLIGCMNREAGCNSTVTFDRKASRSAHFEAL